MVAKKVKRGSIYKVALDPAVGKEHCCVVKNAYMGQRRVVCGNCNKKQSKCECSGKKKK